MTEISPDNILDSLKDKKGKEEKVFYTANFPDLIDLVLNGNEIKFLTSDGELSSTVNIDGLTYKAPPRRGLPPNLQIPKADAVLEYAQKHDGSDVSDDSEVCKACTTLFNDLLKYHEDISELPNKHLYYLLVSWEFHTYLIDKFNFSPIIYFYSIAERGKSRTIKGMINVAYRGIRKVDISDAQLIRDCTHLRATLAFDMMDFWEKIKTAGSVDIILNRYERGSTVSRINRPEKGAFQDMDYYDVFGATLLGTNEIIHEIADTRAIPIIMRKADRDFENEVTPLTGLELKEQLVAFKLAHFNDEIPKVSKIVKSRLGDIVRPLHQIILMTNPTKEQLFVELIKEIEQTKLTEKSNSIDAEIIQCWIKAKNEMVSGVVACQGVANFFNEGKDEKEKLASRKVGNILRSFSFQPTKTSTGALGFFWNEQVTEKLVKEHGLLLVSELPETSETSDSQAQTDEPINLDKLPF
jgi:hypothetical protein